MLAAALIASEPSRAAALVAPPASDSIQARFGPRRNPIDEVSPLRQLPSVWSRPHRRPTVSASSRASRSFRLRTPPRIVTSGRARRSAALPPVRRPLLRGADESVELNPEGDRETLHGTECRRLMPPFDLADIGSVERRRVGERLLGQSFPLPHFAEHVTERGFNRNVSGPRHGWNLTVARLKVYSL